MSVYLPLLPLIDYKCNSIQSKVCEKWGFQGCAFLWINKLLTLVTTNDFKNSSDRESREKLRRIKSRLDVHLKFTMCHQQSFVRSMLEGLVGRTKNDTKN